MDSKHRYEVYQERFTISSNVILPSSTYDYETGTLVPDFHIRRRTQADRLRLKEKVKKAEKLAAEKERLQKQKGARISFRFAAVILCSLFLIGSGYLLYQVGKWFDVQKTLKTTQESIATCRNENQAYRTTLEEKTNQGKICYYASQNLGMIPASESGSFSIMAGENTILVSVSGSAENLLSDNE